MQQKGIISVFGILVSIILLALVFGVVSYYNKKNVINNVDTQPTSNLAPPSDETTNWKLYSNPDYKFSFKYPSDSRIDFKPADGALLTIFPPYTYELSKSEMSIYIMNQSGEDQISKLILSDMDTNKQPKNSNAYLLSGVLPEKLEIFPTKKFYIYKCPDIGSNCQKFVNHYLSIHNYIVSIKTVNYTDIDFKSESSEKTLDKIIATFKFAD